MLTAGSWRGSAASLWLAARFWLLERHRHRTLVLERVRGIPTIVLEDVFNPALFGSSELLLRSLEPLIRPGMRVLDMGTGSGLIAVGAARLGADVVAVDLLAQAVRCATINALLNGVQDRVDARHGDRFAPVIDDRFDLVLFNPPYFSGPPRAAWETAWRSPDALQRFAAGVQTVLRPGGSAVLALSSRIPDLAALLADAPLDVEVLQRKRYGGEELTIQRWTPRDSGGGAA
jgi:release factor glutamine methyltransferase